MLDHLQSYVYCNYKGLRCNLHCNFEDYIHCNFKGSRMFQNKI